MVPAIAGADLREPYRTQSGHIGTMSEYATCGLRLVYVRQLPQNWILARLASFVSRGLLRLWSEVRTRSNSCAVGWTWAI